MAVQTYTHKKYVATRAQRLSAVVTVFLTENKKCSKCGRIVKDENVLQVVRWNSGKTQKIYLYCKNCCETPEDVLAEVDRDEILYGIAQVDDFFEFKKEDITLNEKFMYNLLNGLNHK